MQAKSPRYILAIVSLLAFLLSGPTGVQGYVWCLGEDGHAALELAESNACRPAACPEEQECHDEEDTIHCSHQEEHCGPCLDIQASLQATCLRNQQHQKDLIAPAGVHAPGQSVTSPVCVQLLTNNHLSLPPPRISQTILAHRTVVLLN